MKKGDTVVSINGEKVADFSEIAAKIDANPGRKLVFKVKRGKNQVLNISLKPKTVTEEGKNQAKSGWLQNKQSTALRLRLPSTGSFKRGTS